jgi:hypothetical protein
VSTESSFGMPFDDRVVTYSCNAELMYLPDCRRAVKRSVKEPSRS